jgi:hypothetical protein
MPGFSGKNHWKPLDTLPVEVSFGLVITGRMICGSNRDQAAMFKGIQILSFQENPHPCGLS